MSFELFNGDCLEVMRGMADNSIDSVVTDPPYGLSDHRPAEVVACLSAWLAGEPYAPKGKGFMGKTWDAWVPGPEVWRECLRVLKPGGHMLVFAGTRSMDLMSMAIRLAGFELRDSIGYAHDSGGAPLLAWTYGSGFPKSHNVSKAIDAHRGAERPVIGRRSDGPSSWMLAQKEEDRANGGTGMGFADGSGKEYDVTGPASPEASQWEGWGTALKPAWEPIILARKPLDGTVAENVLAHDTGALNIDGCRVHCDDAQEGRVQHGGGIVENHTSFVLPDSDHVSPAGRWPANVIHDGSDEVLSAFPSAPGQQRADGPLNGAKPSVNTYGDFGPRDQFNPRGDKGSAARFFYCAKASKNDRDDGLSGRALEAVSDGRAVAADNAYQRGKTLRANIHPTVKPTDLMRYLCRLVTPPGGTVLDPFMGSGSTGRGAVREGFGFVGIERDPQYAGIARARIEVVKGRPSPSGRAAKNPTVPPALQPSLFDDEAA